MNINGPEGQEAMQRRNAELEAMVAAMRERIAEWIKRGKIRAACAEQVFSIVGRT